MSERRCIPLEERDAWDGALQEIPHGFHHTWDFADAMHQTTGFRTFLYSFCSAEGRVACAIFEREVRDYVDIATPSGLSGFVGTGSWADFASDWCHFVRKQGYVSGYVGLHPLFDGRRFGTDPFQHNSIYVLDLRQGRDALLRRMDRNRSRQLGGWEGRANRFILDREAIGAFLSSAYEPFMLRVGARPPYLLSTALEGLCHSDRCIAVGVGSSRRLEAAYLFGATPYAADCLINVATDEGRKHATDLLWYGVNEYLQRKIPFLNLGGGAREDDSVARSKQRFRPQRLPLTALREIYRPKIYAELCRSAGVEARSAAEYFPAYRARTTASAVSPS